MCKLLISEPDKILTRHRGKIRLTYATCHGFAGRFLRNRCDAECRRNGRGLSRSDVTLKRNVAIKVIPECWSRDPEGLRRFEQEAQALRPICWPPSSQWVASSGFFHNSP